MISAVSIETARNTTLQLLKKTTGDDDEATNKSTAPESKDPFDQLFATDLDMADAVEETDNTYQPVPPKVKPPTVTTSSGKVVEGLVDGGGEVTDDFGNQIPIAFHITWNGLELARVYSSGSVTASSSFDYSSIFDPTGSEDEKGLSAGALARMRFEKLTAFFAKQPL